jgi:heme/copper-type cytochrome/quinol oxidase subunit 1
MKTAEKLAAGWLLTLGFIFMVVTVSAVGDKPDTQRATTSPILIDDYEFQDNNVTYESDDTALGGIILAIPSIILGGWLAWGLQRQGRQEKTVSSNQQVSDRLQSIFYRMLQENHGRITVLGFAMQSQLPAAVARKYLDQQAQEFNANFKVSDEGVVSYHFDI